MRYNTFGKAPFGKDWDLVFLSYPFLGPLSLSNNSQALAIKQFSDRTFSHRHSYPHFGGLRTIWVRSNVTFSRSSGSRKVTCSSSTHSFPDRFIRTTPMRSDHHLHTSPCPLGV